MRIFVGLMLLCLSSLGFADTLTIPAKPAAYVNDYAHLLTPEQARTINAELQAFDQKTSTQIVVASFDSLKGDSLEDFSIHLAEKWKIGSAAHDNGVILLIIKESHDVRIEVGYGLEGVLTDALSSVIIRQDIAPEFAKGNFDQGIEAGVQSIMQATQGEYQRTHPDAMQSPSGWSVLLYFIGILFVFSIIVRCLRNGPEGEKRAWWIMMLLSVFSGRSGQDGRDDNDDFQGGGGGFGGGGASGKW